MREEQLAFAKASISASASAFAASAVLEEDALVVGSTRIPLPEHWVSPPAKPKEDPLLALPHALPSRAHGETGVRLH